MGAEDCFSGDNQDACAKKGNTCWADKNYRGSEKLNKLPRPPNYKQCSFVFCFFGFGLGQSSSDSVPVQLPTVRISGAILSFAISQRSFPEVTKEANTLNQKSIF